MDDNSRSYQERIFIASCLASQARLRQNRHQVQKQQDNRRETASPSFVHLIFLRIVTHVYAHPSNRATKYCHQIPIIISAKASQVAWRLCGCSQSHSNHFLLLSSPFYLLVNYWSREIVIFTIANKSYANSTRWSSLMDKETRYSRRRCCWRKRTRRRRRGWEWIW